MKNHELNHINIRNNLSMKINFLNFLFKKKKKENFRIE